MPVAPVGQASLATPDAFWTQVLVDMGAPVTQSNISALRAWSEREGGGGAWNPLNTTRPAPGSTSFNSVGVQNYTSAAEGAQATADSINNGLYPSIVSAFKSGGAFSYLVSGGQGPVGQQLRKWSGGAYNNVSFGASNYVSPNLRGYPAGGVGTQSADAASVNEAGSTGNCNSLGVSINNASKTPIVGGLPAEAQIAGFFGWITQGCVQKRLFYQGLGALLILYGLKFMGHGEGIKIVMAPAHAAAGGVKDAAAGLAG